MSLNKKRVAVIIPAHNEQASIAKVVSELSQLKFGNTPVVDDIIVCDNASDDSTARLAFEAGAKVVYEPNLGYGQACLTAMGALKKLDQRPSIVAFVDADYSVKASELTSLLAELERGSDLVVGCRENALLQKGALSPHQRLGNRLASTLIQFIWKKNVSDLGPFRVMRYSRLLELDMQDRRFGWTVEMQVKAIQAGFTYSEVPVTTQPRIGKSKISGTVRGTIGAAFGIFGKIFQLYKQERQFLESLNRAIRLSN